MLSLDYGRSDWGCRLFPWALTSWAFSNLVRRLIIVRKRRNRSRFLLQQLWLEGATVDLFLQSYLTLGSQPFIFSLLHGSLALKPLPSQLWDLFMRAPHRLLYLDWAVIRCEALARALNVREISGGQHHIPSNFCPRGINDFVTSRCLLILQASPLFI